MPRVLRARGGAAKRTEALRHAVGRVRACSFGNTVAEETVRAVAWPCFQQCSSTVVAASESVYEAASVRGVLTFESVRLLRSGQFRLQVQSGPVCACV